MGECEIACQIYRGERVKSGTRAGNYKKSYPVIDILGTINLSFNAYL